MLHSWLLKPKFLVFVPLALLLVLALACGDDDTPTPRPTATSVPSTAVPDSTATPVPPSATTRPPATTVPRSTIAPPLTSPPPPTARPSAPTATPTPVPQPVVPTALGPATPTTPPIQEGLEPVYGGIVPMSAIADIQTWDPHGAKALLDLEGMSKYYTGLLQYDPHNTQVVICDLCTEFSADAAGTAWTFKIHEGVMWWDGVEVTAEDVAWSINRIVSPEDEAAVRTITGTLGNYVDRAEVVGKYTVLLHTKAPAGFFTRLLGLDEYKIMPKHWVEAGNDPKAHDNILGNGPFMPVKYRIAVSYEAEKNPNYFRDGLPYFDGTKTFILTDPGTELAAYKTERVLMSGSVQNDQKIESLNRLAEDQDFIKKFDIWPLPGINGVHLIVNTTRAPYDDPKVREAIDLAIYRQPIMQALGQGRYTIGKAMSPNNPFALPDEEVLARPGYREQNGEKHPGDIARARQLWAEAGYSANNVLEAVIIAPTLLIHPEQAQIIKSQLEENLVHINIEFRPLDVGGWIGALIGKDYDMSSSGRGARTNDPDDRFALIYTDHPRNWSYDVVPGVAELFDAQSRELDFEKRQEINWEMQRLVLDNAPGTMETVWESAGNLVSKRIMTKVGHYVNAAGHGQVMQHYHEWLLPKP